MTGSPQKSFWVQLLITKVWVPELVRRTDPKGFTTLIPDSMVRIGPWLRNLDDHEFVITRNLSEPRSFNNYRSRVTTLKLNLPQPRQTHDPKKISRSRLRLNVISNFWWRDQLFCFDPFWGPSVLRTRGDSGVVHFTICHPWVVYKKQRYFLIWKILSDIKFLIWFVTKKLY